MLLYENVEFAESDSPVYAILSNTSAASGTPTLVPDNTIWGSTAQNTVPSGLTGQSYSPASTSGWTMNFLSSANISSLNKSKLVMKIWVYRTNTAQCFCQVSLNSGTYSVGSARNFDHSQNLINEKIGSLTGWIQLQFPITDITLDSITNLWIFIGNGNVQKATTDMLLYEKVEFVETDNPDYAVLYPTVAEPTEIKTMNLSLAGDIGINFFVSIDNSLVSASAKDIKTVFTVAAVKGREKETVEVALDTNNKNSSGYYQFTINLPAADMTRDITAQVYNGSQKLGSAKTVSVKEYAEKGIVEWTGTDNAKYVPLMKAMLDYGAAAQKLFGIDEDNLANSNFSAKADTVDFENVPSNGYVGENNDASLKPAYTALVLESTTSIRVYLASDIDASGYGVTVTDTESNTAKTAEIKQNDAGRYYFDISDIAASKLDCLYNVKITSGEASFEFTISAVKLAQAAQDTTKFSEEFALVGRTLYLYNQAANAVAA